MLSFVLPRLIWLVIRPSTGLLLLTAVGLALLWTGRPRLGARLLTCAVLPLLACLLFPVDEILTLPLESRFARPDPAPAHVDGIVVLGGAVDTTLTAQRGTPALNSDAERMTAFMALARAYPAARLAFTGGNGGLSDLTMAEGGLSEADVAERLFRSLGLERSILYENASRSTYENAVLLKRAVQPAPGETWLLVTSAMHMPRAVATFQAAGWPVIAWPVAYRVGVHLRFDPERSAAERLVGVDRAVHEWIGLIGYRLTGRTATVVPKP